MPDDTHILIATYARNNTLIGLNVEQTSYAKTSYYGNSVSDECFSDYIDKYVRLFGFNHYDNYDSCYPGHHPGHKHKENPIINDRFKKTTSEHTWIDFPIVPHTLRIIKLDAVKHCITTRNKEKNPVYLMYTPTINEIKLIERFKNVESIDPNLWFCSDWREFDEG